ncbi:hypothetical protein [Streptomyces sp. NPDC048142]|uniref:hypothetical protein n=1 Tax=Streptomyces sp. NPDC048142 TaxID=3365501 RepID=UPI0037191E4B
MAQRRLRSSTVVLGGMGLLALTITSCGSEPDRRCADRTTRETLPSYECRSGNGSSGSTGGSGGSGGSGRGSYYYGGDSSDGKVQGGSFDKSAVDRGGFGCARSGGG